MKRKLLWLLPLLCALPNITTAQDYEHLNISTGLNADVIANGVGSASLSTSIAVDNADYNFMATDFQATASSTPPAYALPASGLITSAPTPGLTFQLAGYAGNNSLRIPTANTSGTLTFTNQVSATKIYLLATSGSGTSTITGTITFTDNTTQAITSSVIPDWFFSNALPVAASGFGRVNRTTNVMENPANDPRLYQLAINILPANQPKQIASIEFTKTSTAEGVLNIFAITAELLGECPSPIDVTAVSMPDSGTVSWTAPALLPAVGYEYYYSTSSTPPAEDATPSGNIAVGTNTVTIDELATGQQYYVWVRSSCGDTDKGPWVMTTFTTGQITATYTAGDISTLYNTSPTITSTTSCPGTLSVTVPAGYEIASVSTAYTMTTDSNGFMSEQRSLLVCTSTNTTEAQVSSGVGGTGGTMTYNRTGLDIADGATGTVNFELRAWRTYGASGCNVTYNKVDNNSWTITVTYQPACTPPATPTAQESQTLCADATVADLSAQGSASGMLQWSATEGGTILDETATLEEGSYFVREVVEDCESEWLEVTVYINPEVPAVATETEQSLCEGNTVGQLYAVGANTGIIQWSETEGGTTLDESTELESGSYFVRQVIGSGCESEWTEVTVIINAIPNAPTGSELQDFTTGETVTDLDITTETGYTVNWYIYNDMGVLISIEPTAALEDGETYYAAQAIGECESELLGITVNEVLSASQFAINGLTIYPNPANDIITLSYKEMITEVNLYNLLGQQVLNTYTNGNTVQVSVANIAAGTYIAEVTAANGEKQILKIIKK